MNVTTIDPPELMKFVRKNYPDVIMERPEINFYKLIVKEKSLPTQNIRFCCKHLKEQSGAGTVTVLGIRKAESVRRQRRNEFEVKRKRDFIYSSTLDQFNIDNETMIVCLNGKDKIMLSPIINWSNSDIWSFIRKRNLEYCQLYDHGYHRIGCILCPMQSKKQKQMDIVRYPGVVREIKKSIKKLIDIGKYRNLGNADDVFDWWVSGVSEKKFLAEKNQCKIEL